MQKKETKKEQSFIEKYLPVLANKKVFERFGNLFSAPNIFMVLIEICIIKCYLAYLNTIFFIQDVALGNDMGYLEYDYEGYTFGWFVRENLQYLYTDAGRITTILILLTFTIAQYINFKREKYSIAHFLIMLLVMIIFSGYLFFWTSGASLGELIREIFGYDFSCHMAG